MANTIDINDIYVKDEIGFGAFGITYVAVFEGREYCFKRLKKTYPSDIMKNLKEMTKEEFSSEFAPPLIMVKHRFKTFGYLCDYKRNTEQLYITKNEYEKKKLLLTKAKLALIKLHREYKRVHGDISTSNIIYNCDKELAYIIDFDSSLKFGEEIKSFITIPNILTDYLGYYPFDYLADVYEFNLQTIALITGKSSKNVLTDIKKGEYPSGDNNKMIRKLCKELIFDDATKKLSGEYIIDYL